MTINNTNTANASEITLGDSWMRFGKSPELQHYSYLFVILWCAAPYLDKIVWHYLLSSC